MAKLEYNLDTTELKGLIDFAQGIAKDRTKLAISFLIKKKEAEFFKISQDSLMHFSAHDIFLVLQDMNEQISKI